MTDATVSARVSKDVVEEIERIIKEEKLEKSAAIRKLIYTGLEQYKKEKAVDLLRRGRVSYQKAAEIAGLNIWEFADVLREKGVIWVNGDIEEDIRKARE